MSDTPVLLQGASMSLLEGQLRLPAPVRCAIDNDPPSTAVDVAALARGAPIGTAALALFRLLKSTDAPSNGKRPMTSDASSTGKRQTVQQGTSQAHSTGNATFDRGYNYQSHIHCDLLAANQATAADMRTFRMEQGEARGGPTLDRQAGMIEQVPGPSGAAAGSSIPMLGKRKLSADSLYTQCAHAAAAESIQPDNPMFNLEVVGEPSYEAARIRDYRAASGDGSDEMVLTAQEKQISSEIEAIEQRIGSRADESGPRTVYVKVPFPNLDKVRTDSHQLADAYRRRKQIELDRDELEDYKLSETLRFRRMCQEYYMKYNQNPPAYKLVPLLAKWPHLYNEMIQLGIVVTDRDVRQYLDWSEPAPSSGPALQATRDFNSLQRAIAFLMIEMEELKKKDADNPPSNNSAVDTLERVITSLQESATKAREAGVAGKERATNEYKAVAGATKADDILNDLFKKIHSESSPPDTTSAGKIVLKVPPDFGRGNVNPYIKQINDLLNKSVAPNDLGGQQQRRKKYNELLALFNDFEYKRAENIESLHSNLMDARRTVKQIQSSLETTTLSKDHWMATAVQLRNAICSSKSVDEILKELDHTNAVLNSFSAHEMDTDTKKRLRGRQGDLESKKQVCYNAMVNYKDALLKFSVDKAMERELYMRLQDARTTLNACHLKFKYSNSPRVVRTPEQKQRANQTASIRRQKAPIKAYYDAKDLEVLTPLQIEVKKRDSRFDQHLQKLRNHIIEYNNLSPRWAREAEAAKLYKEQVTKTAKQNANAAKFYCDKLYSEAHALTKSIDNGVREHVEARQAVQDLQKLQNLTLKGIEGDLYGASQQEDKQERQLTSEIDAKRAALNAAEREREHEQTQIKACDASHRSTVALLETMRGDVESLASSNSATANYLVQTLFEYAAAISAAFVNTEDKTVNVEAMEQAVADFEERVKRKDAAEQRAKELTDSIHETQQFIAALFTVQIKEAQERCKKTAEKLAKVESKKLVEPSEEDGLLLEQANNIIKEARALEQQADAKREKALQSVNEKSINCAHQIKIVKSNDSKRKTLRNNIQKVAQQMATEKGSEAIDDATLNQIKDCLGAGTNWDTFKKTLGLAESLGNDQRIERQSVEVARDINVLLSRPRPDALMAAQVDKPLALKDEPEDRYGDESVLIEMLAGALGEMTIFAGEGSERAQHFLKLMCTTLTGSMVEAGEAQPVAECTDFLMWKELRQLRPRDFAHAVQLANKWSKLPLIRRAGALPNNDERDAALDAFGHPDGVQKPFVDEVTGELMVYSTLDVEVADTMDDPNAFSTPVSWVRIRRGDNDWCVPVNDELQVVRVLPNPKSNPPGRNEYALWATQREYFQFYLRESPLRQNGNTDTAACALLHGAAKWPRIGRNDDYTEYGPADYSNAARRAIEMARDASSQLQAAIKLADDALSLLNTEKQDARREIDEQTDRFSATPGFSALQATPNSEDLSEEDRSILQGMVGDLPMADSRDLARFIAAVKNERFAQKVRAYYASKLKLSFGMVRSRDSLLNDVTTEAALQSTWSAAGFETVGAKRVVLSSVEFLRRPKIDEDLLALGSESELIEPSVRQDVIDRFNEFITNYYPWEKRVESDNDITACAAWMRNLRHLGYPYVVLLRGLPRCTYFPVYFEGQTLFGPGLTGVDPQMFTNHRDRRYVTDNSMHPCQIESDAYVASAYTAQDDGAHLGSHNVSGMDIDTEASMFAQLQNKDINTLMQAISDTRRREMQAQQLASIVKPTTFKDAMDLVSKKLDQLVGQPELSKDVLDDIADRVQYFAELDTGGDVLSTDEIQERLRNQLAVASSGRPAFDPFITVKWETAMGETRYSGLLSNVPPHQLREVAACLRNVYPGVFATCMRTVREGGRIATLVYANSPNLPSDVEHDTVTTLVKDLTQPDATDDVLEWLRDAQEKHERELRRKQRCAALKRGIGILDDDLDCDFNSGGDDDDEFMQNNLESDDEYVSNAEDMNNENAVADADVVQLSCMLFDTGPIKTPVVRCKPISPVQLCGFALTCS